MESIISFVIENERTFENYQLSGFTGPFQGKLLLMYKRVKILTVSLTIGLEALMGSFYLMVILNLFNCLR